jgi:hypothetical protein
MVLNKSKGSSSIDKFFHEAKVYLAGMDFSKLKLRKTDLNDMNLAGACLDETEFDDCNLTNTKFGHASCVRTKFRDSNLSNADFQYANCTEADFGGAKLPYTNFQHANCAKANFYNSNLEHSRMDGTNITLSKISAIEFDQIASLVDAKIFDLEELNNPSLNSLRQELESASPYRQSEILFDNQNRLASPGVKNIEPIQKKIVSQYKKLINDSTNIQSLIDLFHTARCDENLRFECPLFDSGKVYMGEKGKTASCKEVTHAVVEQLVEIVEKMSKSGTLLDQQTAQDLVELYKMADIGFSYNFFGKSRNLPSSIEKNQSIQPTATDKNSLGSS